MDDSELPDDVAHFVSPRPSIRFFFTQGPSLFLTVYCVAFATDVLDGYLARRLHLESYLGMRLDSFADYFLIALLAYLGWFTDAGALSRTLEGMDGDGGMPPDSRRSSAW